MIENKMRCGRGYMRNDTILTCNQKRQIHFFEITFYVYISWFFLPICRGYLFGGIFNIVFFSFYALAVGQLLLLNLKTYYKKEMWLVVYPVLYYIIVLTILCVLNVKDSNRHVRISFTFWGVLLYYFMLEKYPESRKRVSRYVLCLFLITYITTFVGIAIDGNAARTITHASSGEEVSSSLLKKNIAGIYFVQMSIMFVPFAMFRLMEKKRGRLLSVAFLLIEFLFLMRASFTISLVMYFCAIGISLVVLKNNKDKRMIFIKVLGISFLFMIMVIIDFEYIFKWMGENIDNSMISERMFDMYNLLIGEKDTGDAGIRLELYTSSLKTFLDNPFGVGPNYSYVIFDEGIGHHSQMLDDFARYGIAGVWFYFVFLRNYYRFLKCKFEPYCAKPLAIPIIILYSLFLILNISFRSSAEGVMMFLILPEILEITDKSN